MDDTISSFDRPLTHKSFLISSTFRSFLSGEVRERGRSFVPRHTCVVGGQVFHLVHRMEGRWSGHVSTVNSSGNHSTTMETLTSTSLSFVGGGGGEREDGAGSHESHQSRQSSRQSSEESDLLPSHWREDTWLTAPNGVTRR